MRFLKEFLFTAAVLLAAPACALDIKPTAPSYSDAVQVHNMNFYVDEISNLLGAQLVTVQGENIGFVDEVIVTVSGDIAGLIIRPERSTGFSDRVAVDLRPSGSAMLFLTPEGPLIALSEAALNTAERFNLPLALDTM